MTRFPSNYFAGMHRLTNLRVHEISSVDKGAGVGVDVVLLKRRQAEAADPSMPKWEPERFTKEREMSKGDKHGQFHAILDGVREKRIGKGVAWMKLQKWHAAHEFSLDRRSETGKPLSDVQQHTRFMSQHPLGKMASEVLRNHGLDDTPEEIQHEMMGGASDLDNLHEHERGKHPGSGRFEATTKADKHGVPAAVTDPAIRKLNELADLVVTFAKRNGRQLSHAKAFTVVCKTDEGKELLKQDWAARGIS
jgi:hypothetical protein